MKSDSHVVINKLSISPCKPDKYFAYMTALFLFAAGIVVGKAVPSRVTVSAVPRQTQSSVVRVTAHGRFGAPRWLQQQAKSQTLVADLNE